MMSSNESGPHRRASSGRFLAVGLVLSVVGCASESTTNTSGTQTIPLSSSPAVGSTKPIRVVIGDDVVRGEISDNPAGRSLAAQLPVTLSFTDHNGKEKAAKLGGQLAMGGMPPGDDPEPRDIGWYAPWGDVVFYYGDVDYFDGIARIGRFTGDMTPITNRTGEFEATIELDD